MPLSKDPDFEKAVKRYSDELLRYRSRRPEGAVEQAPERASEESETAVERVTAMPPAPTMPEPEESPALTEQTATDEPTAPPTEDEPPVERFQPPEPPDMTDAIPDDAGKIRIRVSTARDALPVENAMVVISSQGQGRQRLERIVYTDKSGVTPELELPTVSRELSEQPGNIQPFLTYNVYVDHPGYFSVDSLKVPVFGGVITEQNIQLIPLPEFVSEGQQQDIQNTEPTDL